MRFFPASLLVLILAATSSQAMEVTLRLVRSDAPGQTASTAITRIDVEAELAKQKATERAGPIGQGAQAPPKEQIIEPKAQFDHYSNYMRGIMIDGKIPFYKAYQGSYLGRSDTIHVPLEDGEHVIEPGAHKFSIAAGKIVSEDPTIKITDSTIDVTVYPVTIIAVDGSAIRDMPAEVRRLPVAPRIFAAPPGAEELLPKEEQLSASATFKRLTLYMLANTQGAGYRLSPSDRQFQVTPDGVVIVDETGKPASDAGVTVEGKFTIVLPQMAVPVKVVGKNVNVVISGPAGRLTLESGKREQVSGTFYAFGSAGGADITFGNRASNQPVKFFGDLGTYPRRQILVDATAAETKEPRLMSVSLAGYSVDAGKILPVRVQAMDALDAATIAPMQVAAYLWKQPILQDDATLAALPENPPDSSWQSVRVLATDQPDRYELLMPSPADLPSNVYRLRIVVDRRGSSTPCSKLHTDFIEGIINPAARTTLSVFSPSGRHSFPVGGDMPISAVFKSTSAIPAGKLRITLKRNGQEYPLVDRDLPEQPAGEHPLHYKLLGTATAALSPGDYTIEASLGAIKSNAWSVRIVQPRWTKPFPFISDSRFSFNAPDQGVMYRNVPKDIAQANEARAIITRNCQLLGWQFDTASTDWYIFAPMSSYSGRDSASEVAQVEAALRSNLSLPAHEVFYYQNHWEMVNEGLAAEGIGHINGVIGNFSPNSLIHSVPKEVESDVRKHELIAQVGEKFDNFQGMTPLYPNAAPMGDPEIGDENRGVRLETLAKNFKDKYGFDAPPMSDASRAMQAYIEGKVTPELADAAKRWEAWVYNINCLERDIFSLSKDELHKINPRVKLWNNGPGWGDTGGGNYPAVATSTPDILEVWTGFSDYAWPMIFEDLCRPRYYKIAAPEGHPEIRSVMSSTLYAGCYNNKNHLAAELAAGVDAFGYMGGPVIDPTPLDQIYHQEECRDIRDICRTYGPLFKQIRPAADVGILHPMHQAMYEQLSVDNAMWRKNSPELAMFSAIMHLAIDGYNSDILSEEMIDRGGEGGHEGLNRYKVIIVPVLHYLLPQHLAAIEKFAASGGTVLVGADSTLIPKGARKIDDDFSEIHEADVKWGIAYPLDDAHAYMFGEMMRKAPKLKAILDPVVKPFAQARTNRVLVQTSAAGDGHYTYVWDFSYPSWFATGRLTNNPAFSSWGGEANERTLMPLKETIFFPANVYTYELFTQQPVDRQAAKDGRVEATADLSFTPFRIFVSLPKPIAKLRVEFPERVTLGMHFPVKVTPLSEDSQPINAAIPVQLTLLDAAGQQVWQMSASSLKRYEGEMAAPLGFKEGQWTLRAKELVSGRVLETTLQVDKPAALPFGAAMAEIPEVDVQRQSLIAEFIAARRQDHEPVYILLDESQLSKRMAAAEEAQKALAGLGVKAQIKRTAEDGVYANEERVHLFRGWVEMPPAQYINHHIVLIAGEGESVLVEELQQNQLLVRPLTASYPGPGRGVLALVRSPFAPRKDALCLLGDDAGVGSAIAALAHVSAAPPALAKPPEVVAAAELKPAIHEAEGKLEPGTPFASMDGAPVQVVASDPAGERIAFGTMGYAKNVFVFDTSGKLQVEDKIGHVHTLGLQFLPGGADGKRLAVTSDNITYLRNEDGSIPWRMRGGGGRTDTVHVDPQGRYIVVPENGTMCVYGLDLKPLWKVDDFEKYETTREILFGRKAEFIALLDNGDTVAYRVTGKAPGMAGEYGDDLCFADALTGTEKRHVPIDMDPVYAAAQAPTGTKPPVKKWDLYQDGSYSIVTLTIRPGQVDVLLDKDMKVVQAEHFTTPPYCGGNTNKTNRYLLPDRRLVFTVGDTVCLSDAEWKMARSARTEGLILALTVDEKRGRILVSNYNDEVICYNFSLQEQWRTNLGSAAELALLPDGRIAAGTMRGQACLLDLSGKVLWNQSVSRYAEPEEIEKRWTQLEALPSMQTPENSPWWERLARNIDFGQDIAGLSGAVKADAPLAVSVDGEPFGTYLVEWKHRQTTGAGLTLSLDVTEVEKAVGKTPANPARRLMLSAKPQGTEVVEHALLRLGDRPEKVNLTVQASGDGAADTAVTVRPLAFPSSDHIRIPSLYRGEITEAVRANPPVQIELFFNVFEAGSPHT
ncbi:MAG TPA: hypothetical protein VIL86_09755, partial [Tepidisphaeraceae bacterium]